MREAEQFQEGRSFRPLIASTVIRLAAGWVALGGLTKLLWGVPADLPALLQGFVWPDPASFLSIIVGIELFVAALAFFSPRAGWTLVTALLAVFGVLAGYDAARGAAQCGCFGSMLPIPPAMVWSIDLALLAGVAVARPWKNLSRPERAAWAAVPALSAFSFSILAIAIATGHPNPATARSALENPHMHATPYDKQAPGKTPDETASNGEWQAPAHMPRMVVLAPESWVGQALEQTELARWMDISKLPSSACIILYMDTCPHCRDLLSERAKRSGDLPCVLVRVPTANPNFPVYVKDDVPQGLRVDLPHGTRWSIVVPWEVVIRDGVVESATSHKGRRSARQ